MVRKVLTPSLFGALLSVATGCGDDGGAAEADASADVDAAPAARGTCGLDVELYDRSQPPDWTVVFSTPSGELIGMGELDENGEIERDDCVEGTTVSLFGSRLVGDELNGFERVVYAGVGLGTTVDFDPVRPTLPGFNDVTVALGHGQPLEDAEDYAGSFGCGEVEFTAFDNTRMFNVPPTCVTEDGYSFLAMAKDGDGVPLAFDYLVDQTVSEIELNTWRNPANVELSIANPPDFLYSVDLEVLRDGFPFFPAERWIFGLGSNFVNDFVVPPFEFADEIMVEATISGGNSFLRRYLSPRDELELDGADFLPELMNPFVDLEDPETPKFLFAEAPLPEGTFRATLLQWDSSAQGTDGRILMVSPGTMTSITLPPVPEELRFFAVPEETSDRLLSVRAVELGDDSYQVDLADNRKNLVIHALEKWTVPGLDYRSRIRLTGF